MRYVFCVLLIAILLQGCNPFAPRREEEVIKELKITKASYYGILDQDYKSTIIINNNSKADSITLFCGNDYEYRYQRDTLFINCECESDTVINGVVIKFSK